MAIKGRQALYSIFVNGAIPTQDDYRNLIDSALNRRDDHFFGEWENGRKYCKGDVVIFKKALYKLIPKETEKPCPPTDEDGATNSGTDCYCSLVEPDIDEENWCIFELDLKDKDWEIICDSSESVTKIYQMTAQVGIGTDDPMAKLDVTNQNKILIEPNDLGSPAISMQKHELLEPSGTEIKQYVKYRLTDEVCWETDGLAYVFKLEGEEPPLDAMAKSTSISNPVTSPGITPLLLMKITTNANKIPQVGIGTNDPKGGLHVHQSSRGDVLLNPANHQQPGVLVVNLEPDGNGYYALSGVNKNYAFFATNATDGFRFKKDDKDREGMMDCDSVAEGTDLIAILGDGRVGVGTNDPKSNVEISGGDSGSIRFQLGNDAKNISNPALSINNLRPHSQQQDTYGTIGIDDSYLTLISDAPSGFVIKNGDPYGTNDNEVNINQGRPVFFVSATGQTGIKTGTPPEDYDLDVYGHLRSYTAYLETNSRTVVKTTDLKEDKVLEKISKLNPTRFAWQIPDLKGGGEDIGFMAQNVYEQFPELVKRTGADGKSIAYGNMTAVLVQAIQDQQKMIKEMEERICDLEAKAGISRD